MAHTVTEDWLAARARTTPEATALIIGEAQWNYYQLNELVENTAANLQLINGASDRVACLLNNNLAFVCLVHAAARCGIVLVPLNTRLTRNEILWQLARADCSILVHDDQTTALAGDIDSESVCLIQPTDLLEPSAANQAHFPPFDLDRLQGIIYSSGTTGKPKGVMLSYANHFYSAMASAYHIGLSPADRWLCCLPLYHVGGLAILFRSCLYGTAVELHDGFDMAKVSNSLDTQDITLISLVPTMLHRLLDYRGDGEWPATLRLVLLGGAATSQELIAECQSRGIRLAPTYGLTEASSQVATMLPERVAGKPGSVGRPLLFTRVAIVSADGRPVAPGESGEILVQGPSVMAGYDQDHESTHQTLRDGWLHTGDIGTLDADGDLWILLRREDMILSGGENVYPAEVEDVLRDHPLIVEVCVVGIDDQEWGQRVSAAVVTADNEAISIEEMYSFCRLRLAGYKCPRRLIVIEALPRTASGKIQRQAVANLFKVEQNA